MKPTIPETATVVRVDGQTALVRLNPEKSCRGCGAAAIGLCKPSGGISFISVRNTMDARPGDTVRIALDGSTGKKGFLLAYFIPIASLITGSLLGYVFKDAVGIPSLDVIAGFASFLASSVFTFRRLRRLNARSSLTIKEVVRENKFSFQDPYQAFP